MLMTENKKMNQNFFTQVSQNRSDLDEADQDLCHCKRFLYLLHHRAAKAQASLWICTHKENIPVSKSKGANGS